jgi:DNA-binding transcriptional LysR family regulator
VLDEPLVAAIPFEHPLASRAKVPLRALALEPFLMTARTRGSGYHDYVLATCREAGFSPRIVQEGSHFDVLSLVAAGIGVAIVPSSLREIRRGDVIYRPLRERVRTQLVMVSRRTSVSPVLREFLIGVKRLGRHGLRRKA